jgi:hypothetical protein
MNCPPEHSGCWYCMTDFDSPLGWWSSCEFDTVLHVECIEYEHNENRSQLSGNDVELNLIMRELGYLTNEEYKLYSMNDDDNNNYNLCIFEEPKK